MVAVVTTRPVSSSAFLKRVDDPLALRVVGCRRGSRRCRGSSRRTRRARRASRTRVGRVHRRPGRVAERVDALPADGPEAEGELVLGGGRVRISLMLESFSVCCRCPAGGAVAQLGVLVTDVGSGSARRTSWTGWAAQAGGSAVPASAQAAWRAAPSATYSAGSGTATGVPKIAGAMRAHRGAAAAAADQQHAGAARTPCGDEVVDGVGEASTAAPRPPRGPGSRAWRCAVVRPVQRAGGVRPVRGALAVQVGQQGEAAGAGRGGQRQLRQLRRGRRRAWRGGGRGSARR